MRRVFLLLHAPIAFWNLFSSPPSSCASEVCFVVSCAASRELCSSVSIPPSILAYVGSPVEKVWPRESASHSQASCTIPRKCIESASTCMGGSDYVCGQLSLQPGSAAAHRAQGNKPRVACGGHGSSWFAILHAQAPFTLYNARFP